VSNFCVTFAAILETFVLNRIFFTCRRCATIEGNRFTVEEHTVPFWNLLPKYPTVEDVKRLHTERKANEDPLPFPIRWENDRVSVSDRLRV
jgi:hypothetical protein